MKAPILFSLGILAFLALPLQAAQQKLDDSDWMRFAYPSAVAGTDTVATASTQKAPDSFLDVAKPSVPLSGPAINTTMQLLDVNNQFSVSPNAIAPITNGPAVAPVPETGSSIMLLVLGAIGMVALRRGLRHS